MTRSPRCPACGSSAVSPDPTNGGAGRNVCHCGHRAPVRDFYDVPPPGHARVEYYADRLRDHLRDNPINFAELYQQQPVMVDIPDGYKWDNKTGTVIPKPGRVNYVTEPVAAVTMPNGELNDMRHNRDPAPIRQYKDDD